MLDVSANVRTCRWADANARAMTMAWVMVEGERAAERKAERREEGEVGGGRKRVGEEGGGRGTNMGEGRGRGGVCGAATAAEQQMIAAIGIYKLSTHAQKLCIHNCAKVEVFACPCCRRCFRPPPPRAKAFENWVCKTQNI